MSFYQRNVSEQPCTHSRKRAFHCEVCEKAFGHHGQLMRHKLIHSGERPFLCNVCNKAFIQRSHLMQHKQIHTRERPVLCDIQGVSKRALQL